MSKNERALKMLKGQPWAAPLISNVESRGGLREAANGHLFELRFAYEMCLACPGSSPKYEFDANVGGSTVDFLLPHGQLQWLIELVCLDQSQPVRDLRSASRVKLAPGATMESFYLASDAKNERETPRAELIRVGEKLAGKIWAGGRARKFPPPAIGWAHALVVNMSGFEGTGDPDAAHCLELIHGSKAVPPDLRSDPEILGLFEARNTREGPQALQERIDIIAFVAERLGADDDEEIRRTILFAPNPRTNASALVREFPVALPPEQRDPLHQSLGGA